MQLVLLLTGLALAGLSGRNRRRRH
jgi:hypothetical protein